MSVDPASEPAQPLTAQDWRTPRIAPAVLGPEPDLRTALIAAIPHEHWCPRSQPCPILERSCLCEDVRTATVDAFMPLLAGQQEKLLRARREHDEAVRNAITLRSELDDTHTVLVAVDHAVNNPKNAGREIELVREALLKPFLDEGATDVHEPVPGEFHG